LAGCKYLEKEYCRELGESADEDIWRAKAAQHT
jgi:hypothetical protein